MRGILCAVDLDLTSASFQAVKVAGFESPTSRLCLYIVVFGARWSTSNTSNSRGRGRMRGILCAVDLDLTSASFQAVKVAGFESPTSPVSMMKGFRCGGSFCSLRQFGFEHRHQVDIPRLRRYTLMMHRLKHRNRSPSRAFCSLRQLGLQHRNRLTPRAFDAIP